MDFACRLTVVLVVKLENQEVSELDVNERLGPVSNECVSEQALTIVRASFYQTVMGSIDPSMRRHCFVSSDGAERSQL